LGKTIALFVGVLTAAAWASPAAAQNQTSGPVVNLWYGGFVTGVETVQNTGAIFGGEAGARVWRKLDLSLEAGSLGDVVSQKQVDAASPLTGFLEQTQGQTADLTMKSPALYGGLGARWVFEDKLLVHRARPYVRAAIGGARVKHESTFTLNGSDVTNSLDQYGVKLGVDMSGTETKAAITGGAGVLIPVRNFYVDLGYRLTSIQTTETVNVNCFNVGVGARF
jgi:outer membrane protein with beta-barrel domain